jgi:hypothetical protein
MTNHFHFDDGRGRFPDRISVHVPRGFRELVAHQAAQQGLAVSELLRRALYKVVDGERSKSTGGRMSPARSGGRL